MRVRVVRVEDIDHHAAKQLLTEFLGWLHSNGAVFAEVGGKLDLEPMWEYGDLAEVYVAKRESEQMS